MRIYFILFLLFLLSGCSPRQSGYLCDLYEEGHCETGRQGGWFYKVRIPSDNSKSYRDISYSMYFKSRETPGLRVDFWPHLSDAELSLLRESLHCSYRLEIDGTEILRPMEGLRLDFDGGGFWCFDYAGSLMLDYFKQINLEDKKPDRMQFSGTLKIIYKSSIKEIHGSNGGEFQLSFEKE